MMTKTETIKAILRRNPTIRDEFLEDFSASDLDAYLDRLNESSPTPWEVEADSQSAVVAPS